MDEIKLFKSILYVSFVFGTYVALEHYVFDGEFDIWAIAFIPIGKEVLSLGWKYYNIRKKRHEKGFISLKETKYKISDFVWIVFAFGFAAYIRLDLIYYILPLVILDFYLLYFVKKHQLYYFGEWSVEDLVDSDNNIAARNIISIDFQTNKLKISYIENEYRDIDDKKNRRKLVIKRKDLNTPRSWYHFEQIVNDFLENLKKKREENQQNPDLSFHLNVETTQELKRK